MSPRSRSRDAFGSAVRWRLWEVPASITTWDASGASLDAPESLPKKHRRQVNSGQPADEVSGAPHHPSTARVPDGHCMVRPVVYVPRTLVQYACRREAMELVKFIERRNPRRCQPITVCGWTTNNECRQLVHHLERRTQKIRSLSVSRGRGWRAFHTASCCRSARFSSANSRCVRTADPSVPTTIPSHLIMTAQ
jgi:hypothetical protein